MPGTGNHDDDVRTLSDARALSALANPARSRLVDLLTVNGPSTASTLAERTGLAVGSISHHLKALAAAGLVAEAPELARDRRERWWRLVARRTRWSRTEFADDAGAVTAAVAAESLTLRRQFERSRDWLAEGDPAYDRAAFATQTWLRLSPEELHELSEELVAVLARWRDRAEPDDQAGAEGSDPAGRRPVLVFARGFPTDP